MYSLNETIVALATPPGEGAIGVIRLSGNDAIEIVEKIFQGKKLSEQPSHTLHFGRVIDTRANNSPPSEGLGEASPSEGLGEVVDEVVVSLYRAPKSYTGENVVEISCHGSNYVLEQVIQLCTENGAVLAKPGEFTQRAFLNGKLDLTQAEAVADLIASQSSAAHHAAMHNLRGGFSNELKIIRDELIQFSALIELELDFSQEDVEFADRTRLNELIENAKLKIEKLLDSFHLGNVIKQGIKVAIVGRPNVGKSTLLNALLNEERAIVSDIAGTTRDTIEETLNINGIVFRIIDTAGIREHATDVIENIGIERSKKAMEEANIIIALVALVENEPLPISILMEEPQARYETVFWSLTDAIEIKNKYPQTLIVINKSDLLFDFDYHRILDKVPDALFINAKDNIGIDALKNLLHQKVISNLPPAEGTIITNARHYTALKEVMKSLVEIENGMLQNIPGDLIALDIRRCLHFLGEITGEITTEDKLDYIFSKFCIGK